jgi:signal transduction histidine kinase
MGATVLFGWHIKIPLLIQIHPDSPPMQYNTALGFLACGLAGFSVYKSHYSISKLIAFFLIFLGGLTLTEYVLHVDLILDEIFMKHYIVTRTSHSGRMAPNTALCFTVLGLFYLLSSFENKEKTILVRGFLASLVFALSVVALSGYLMGLENDYGWTNLTRMAFHTASGFVMLGLGAILLSWHKKIEQASTLYGFATVILLLLIMGLTSIAYIDRLATISGDIHRHPFMVSNAARHINANLMTMDRTMQDALFSEDEKQLNFALNKIATHSKVVIKEFDLIFERYLGNKEDIQQAHRLFLDWQAISDEIIALVKDGKRFEAIEITKTKGAKQAALLYDYMEKVTRSAEKTAESFRLKALTEKKNSLFMLSLFLMIAVIISIKILIYVVKNNIKQQEELKASHQRLLHSDKLVSLGKLTSSIAHEFNNPIYGIKTLLEHVREEVNPEKENAKFLDIAIKECDRMADLVKKLQRFYKPSPAIKRPTDINQIIGNMLILTHKSMQERRITLIKHLSSDLPKVHCVSDQIEQVFLNILQNAAESIPQAALIKTITLTTETEGSHVKIHIQDSGIGISQEVIKTMFDPFFTTKSAVKGTGLGLSVSYGIIKAHGGEILADSKIDEGTMFSITLPIG